MNSTLQQLTQLTTQDYHLWPKPYPPVRKSDEKILLINPPERKEVTYNVEKWHS
jgi:hypothetical protein